MHIKSNYKAAFAKKTYALTGFELGSSFLEAGAMTTAPSRQTNIYFFTL
jgi:hypothetical protein